ncbi:hypothetical protein RE9431_04680 [Prescottella equi]|uniref:hypothetical protein n=1 Tax=Rhodococcus hoagii TaxID=43767 RepID=UPI001C75F997|nr:hypothetical protein [Prescottella equi]MBM4591723.1 hypothetical protein [Prescottella equi]MBM4598774.1 hypothetical protein [Prescottella equi]BCN62013.1 hypothetical protein RE9431_04680 [Prescottella equi]BCN71865.1 hypothetical protein RE0327_04640 [Prescottella equi]
MRSSRFNVALAREALAARSESAQGWLRGTAPGRTVQRMLSGFVDIEWADRSMTLAAQSFTSVLPVVIVASTIGSHDTFTKGFFDQFGIDMDSVDVSTDGLGVDEPSFAAFGIVGLLMVLLGGTSFARALGRMYGRVWHVPTLKFASWWRWIAVLLSVASCAALIGATRVLLGVPYLGSSLVLFAQFAVWAGLWTLVPYLLTERRLSARVLWSTGMITAAGLTVLRIGGNVVLPRTVATAESKFGDLGLVFTAIGWMFVACGIVVGASVITKALALDEGPVGRYLRGPGEPLTETSMIR